MRILVFSTIFAALAVGCTDRPEPPSEPAADLVAGKSLAEANCVGCHDLSGRGAAPGIPH